MIIVIPCGPALVFRLGHSLRAPFVTEFVLAATCSTIQPTCRVRRLATSGKSPRREAGVRSVKLRYQKQEKSRRGKPRPYVRLPGRRMIRLPVDDVNDPASGLLMQQP